MENSKDQKIGKLIALRDEIKFQNTKGATILVNEVIEQERQEKQAGYVNWEKVKASPAAMIILFFGVFFAIAGLWGLLTEIF